ncbi:MAG TPA: hypothetical protein VH682_30460 [Gemmataceae bacterium]|jgi:hypothetical protein
MACCGHPGWQDADADEGAEDMDQDYDQDEDDDGENELSENDEFEADGSDPNYEYAGRDSTRKVLSAGRKRLSHGVGPHRGKSAVEEQLRNSGYPVPRRGRPA